ncbi:hypothetical protein PR003_g19462 [Phytophthora rubi]|uniref:Uncharacterized protein n=1 Tax=Phytophthora rubi TaxID=129364 RepID=A0A6A4DX05_9STRA|nr:hypothetical protein PR003_g19462 [Phytophthora rubi]
MFLPPNLDGHYLTFHGALRLKRDSQHTLATLRALGQQLALTVDAAQFHLQVAAGDENSTPCSQDDADRFVTLSSEIKGLQTKLQAVLGRVLAQSRHKIVAAATEAPPAEQTDKTIDRRAETESGEDVPEIKPPEHKSSAGRTAKPLEDLPTALQIFVEATGRLILSDSFNKNNGLCSRAMGMCRIVARQLVALLESGNCLDDASACLFRDTLERLTETVVGLQEGGVLSERLVVQVVAYLGRILELADAVSGAPAALASTELRSSRLKLKRYSEEHMDDILMTMHAFVQNAQKQKNPPRGDNLDRAVKTLTCKLQQDITKYNRCQELGLPERSEERWGYFTEVAGFLGDWIERTAVPAIPSKELKSMYLAAKRFGEKFPDRVPSILLKNAKLRVHPRKPGKPRGKQSKTEHKESSS